MEELKNQKQKSQLEKERIRFLGKALAGKLREKKEINDKIQQQNQKQNDNVKQLFEISSDDLDLLKKKCETLEEVIKNIRTEMVNNINNVENYLTQRYDTIFRTMSSERSIHIK